MKISDGSGYYTDPRNRRAIFCIWHNRLSVAMLAYSIYVRKTGIEHRMAAMVSASKDGALLTAILRCFGVQPVRGSTSRRGPQALLELKTWGEKGYDLAITPDGPRGPCYTVHEGVVALGQLTGLDILPASFAFGRKFRLKSWDRFQIPWPFTTCEMRVGVPIKVPREANELEREACRLAIQDTLRSLTSD
jgi:lysophospholipid acyltransferase (LPLAT)-like uncharacterized protein